jgi:hypothetical protein
MSPRLPWLVVVGVVVVVVGCTLGRVAGATVAPKWTQIVQRATRCCGCHWQLSRPCRCPSVHLEKEGYSGCRPVDLREHVSNGTLLRRPVPVHQGQESVRFVRFFKEVRSS